MALSSVIVLLLAPLAAGIRLNSNKCTPLLSGAKIRLKSNLLDNHFITVDEGTGDCGTPQKFNDEKHWTCSNFHLKEGKSDDSVFTIVSKSGGPIVSGDKVKLVTNKDGKMVHIDFSIAWPYVMTTTDELNWKGENGTNFVIQKARKVDPSFLLSRSETLDMLTNEIHPVHKDTHAGEQICNGHNIFMVVKDRGMFTTTYSDLTSLTMGGDFKRSDPGPCKMEEGCGYMYMQGDEDKIVGFPHHMPGHSGNPKRLRNMETWDADDAEATANRFTIVAK
jgi:hypothetical protein